MWTNARGAPPASPSQQGARPARSAPRPRPEAREHYSEAPASGRAAASKAWNRVSNNAWSPTRPVSASAPSGARQSSARSNFRDEHALNSHEHSTTVMIQRLAPDRGEDDVRAALSQYGLDTAVDVIYVPMNRKRTSNLGYAFVNFTTTAWTQECLNSISGRSLGALTDDRPCRAAFSKMQGPSFLRHRAEAKAQEQRTRAAQETAASSCEQRAEDPPESTSASYAELAASMLALAQTDEGPQNGETGGDRPVGAHVVVLGEPVSL